MAKGLGASVCRNTLRTPVNLWITGTVGRQFVLLVHCVKFVSELWYCHSEQKCLSLLMLVCQRLMLISVL